MPKKSKKREAKRGKKEVKKAEKPEKKRGFFRTLLRMFIRFIMGLLVTAVLLGVAAFLFYSFYPIKTMAICVNNTATVTSLSCASDAECMEGLLTQQEGMPDIMQQFMKSTFGDLIKCKAGKCEVRAPRGLDTPVECAADEEAMTIKITASKIIPPATAIEFIKQFILTGKLPF
jgi:hypothetical protein